MTTNVEPKPAPAMVSPKLGEELPVFCERCGYSLHGLPQTRCEHCTLLQFHCPECGHHQPINTLRPAFQTMLGRVRGAWLFGIVVFKIMLIGWTLFAWCAMGAAWSYRYDYEAERQAQAKSPNVNVAPYEFMRPRPIDLDSGFAFGLFGIGFGLVLRMALLRWRRGWLVGIVLALMVVGCIALGAVIRQKYGEQSELPSPFTIDLFAVMAVAFVCVTAASASVFGIWTLLVHAFLPKRTANTLLNWQRSLSNQVSALSREG